MTARERLERVKEGIEALHTVKKGIYEDENQDALDKITAHAAMHALDQALRLVDRELVEIDGMEWIRP